jgi:Response regulator containing CheY-like receiver domain and AraC-type DNA-binding domain
MAKVLIVDDSSLGRKLLKRILLKTSHEVIAEAENGEQGILEYKRLKPDIVTMDVDMPGINGLEASRRILNDYPDARIIIISGHEQNDLKEGMDKYGLRHFIIKPVTEENVNTAFQRVLSDVKKIIVESPKNVKVGKTTEFKGPETKVSVNHHSVMNIFFAVKISEGENLLTLVIEEGVPFNGFLAEDPIVLGYESNGVHIMSQCEISEVDPVSRSLKLKTVNSLPLETETVYQNLPASIFTDIRMIGTRKRYAAIIKTFMVNEIIFLLKDDIGIEEKVSLDIFHKNKVLTIDGSIFSKSAGTNYFEYLLKLDFSDYNLKKIYLSYLQDLAYNMENAIVHQVVEILK